ncbi:EH domain-containing protein 1-like isoform X2 [Gossypium raimondii]|uniref:EH domain-containing protein 1-like isoform X2 n=1 Tax=Gossypium raimondii TaxID=29730 RepID=UPI00227CE4C0|nr:EH domain-containing protein 1-like isoform X2 [Gossypium raimondii]
MEGLDTLIMRKKQSSKSSSLESNGSSSNQTSSASQWFSSKSSKKSGTDERSVPRNTIAVQADMPFSGLTTFGTAFLSKFECSQMPHPDRSKWFGELPWEESLRDAHEFGKLVLF